MTQSDRDHWDERYRSLADSGLDVHLPERFVGFARELAQASTALELACGAGQASVWLAAKGVQVTAYDVSPVAIERATQLAEQAGVADRCTFAVADFDDGLPDGDPVDLVLCNMFRDARLDAALADRLRPGGMLAIAALSEVGASPGRFRVGAGELTVAFRDLDLIAGDEGDGVAWLFARKT